VDDRLLLSSEVREFIDAHVRSIAHLELLILLLRTPEKHWSAQAIATEIGVPQKTAETMLDALCSAGLCDVKLGGEVLYRYAPANDDLRRSAERVAHARVAVLQHIFSNPPSSIQDLADAFRIKRRPKDG
jgi:predicted DNA-binding transcriptional regulator YafY